VTLQGSLGTLDLPAVLGVLAVRAKSGEVRVTGDRTTGLARTPALQGSLWLDSGRLAGVDVGGITDLVEAVVELLWLAEGTFTFEPGPAVGSGRAAEVREVLSEALVRLAEWRDIEQVVPSRRAWLELNPEPPGHGVVLRADQWRLVVAVAGGQSVEATLRDLDVGDLPGCRAIKEIVEAGLVTVHTGTVELGSHAVVVDLAARRGEGPSLTAAQ
jgi:hypothetical protein